MGRSLSKCSSSASSFYYSSDSEVSSEGWSTEEEESTDVGTESYSTDGSSSDAKTTSSSRSSSHTRTRRHSKSPQKEPGNVFLTRRTTNRRSRLEDYQKHWPPIRATAIPIEQTEALCEQDSKFRELRMCPEKQREWNKKHPHGVIVAYTDGSRLETPGGGRLTSGYGIYFGPKHELNRAERIEGQVHNSCLAEILAARRALELIRGWRLYQNEPVILRTDFLSLVQIMSKGVKRRTVFAEEYYQLEKEAKSMPRGVHFEHVYGHGDDPGNQAADELARQAALSHQPLEIQKRRSRSECRVKDWTGVRGRAASRENNYEHIRSHSVFVPGRRN